METMYIYKGLNYLSSSRVIFSAVVCGESCQLRVESFRLCGESYEVCDESFWLCGELCQQCGEVCRLCESCQPVFHDTPE